MFEKELSHIKNPIVKKITEEGIALIPDYFYTVPASSSGKYHPSYALGDGGLYRHVQAAVSISKMLFTIHDFTEVEQDLIIASLILHDGWKQGFDGSGGKTLHAHPVIAANALRANISTEFDGRALTALELICRNISSHMGQWNTNDYDSTVLPLPRTKMEKFVHLCDYIASRKSLEYNFSVG